MALLPHAHDFLGFFFEFSIFFVQNATYISKGSRGEIFWIFPDFEGSKDMFFSLMDGGRQNVTRERRENAWRDKGAIPSLYLQNRKRRKNQKFSFKTACFFPKGVSREKDFGFSCFRGFESFVSFAYWWREAQNVPMERRLWLPWAWITLFPSAAFSIWKGGDSSSIRV